MVINSTRREGCWGTARRETAASAADSVLDACRLLSLTALQSSARLPPPPSHFSRVRPCATPETAAHQAPPSPGCSRQEHWGGLPVPSPVLNDSVYKGSYTRPAGEGTEAGSLGQDCKWCSKAHVLCTVLQTSNWETWIKSSLQETPEPLDLDS